MSLEDYTQRNVREGLRCLRPCWQLRGEGPGGQEGGSRDGEKGQVKTSVVRGNDGACWCWRERERKEFKRASFSAPEDGERNKFTENTSVLYSGHVNRKG